MFLNGKLMKERAIWRWLNSGSSFDVLYLQLRIGIGSSIYKGEVWSEPFWSPTAALMLVKAMGLIATGTKFNGISILVTGGGGGVTSKSCRLKGWRPDFCILLFWSHPHFCTSTGGAIFLDFWHQSFLDPCRLWSTKTLTYSRVGHINTDSLPKGTETKEYKTSYHCHWSIYFKVVMHFRHYYVCFSPSRVKMVVPYIVNNVKWLFEKKNAWTSQHLGRYGQSLLQWSGNGWLGKVDQCDMFWAGGWVWTKFICKRFCFGPEMFKCVKLLWAELCTEMSSIE